jgi:type III restriction enzyme
VEAGDAAPPAPSNARRYEVKRNNEIYASKAFQEFWSKLCRQTDYKIKVNTGELIKQCVEKLNAKSFPDPKIVLVRGQFVMTKFKLTLLSVENGVIKMEIKISDTLGNEEIYKRNFKKGDDLSKIAKDERLKGYKIVDLREAGEFSEINFADRGTLRVNESTEFSSEKGQKGDPQARQEAQTTYPVFNFIQRAADVTHLKRDTLVQIFKGMKEEQKTKIFKNPEGFTAIFIDTIKNTLADHIADNIEYSLTEELMEYAAEDMFPETRKYPQKELVEGSGWSLYDQVQIDSEIERKFVEYKLNEDSNVLCYFKFPNQFKISLPKLIGNYNPDWGIIRYDEDKKLKLELVRETKGNVNPNLLQYPNEKRKIDCATKHFALTGVDYRQIKGDEVNWWKPKE